MEMDYKKWILGGVVFVVISQVLHIVFSMLTMDYYLDPAFLGVWSKIMMPTAGPPPTSFFYYSIFFGLIIGLIYAYAFILMKPVLIGKDLVQEGVFFGVLIFLVSAIPGFLMNILFFNVPTGLVMWWAFAEFLILAISGVAIAKIMK